ILLSSFIFLTMAWLKGQKLFRVDKRELGRLLVTGILFWFCGNGFVTFAEKDVESGYAALLIGSVPIWAALMECALDRKSPSWRLVLGLLVGISGVAILNGPVWMHGTLGERWASVALILAAAGWASASLWQKRRPFKLPAELTTAYQTFFGSTALLITAGIVHEPFPHPTHQALMAW